jgi:aminomethyltransferase
MTAAEGETSSDVRVSPLDAEHRYLFADMREVEGFVLPWSYATQQEERDAVMHRTTVSDISFMGKIRLSGKSADPFLFGMFDADFDVLARLGAGTMATFSSEIVEEAGLKTPPRVEVIRSGVHEFMLLTRFDQTSLVFELFLDYAEVGDEEQLEEGQVFLSDETNSLAGVCLTGKDAQDIISEMGKVGDADAPEKVANLPEFTLGMLHLDTIPTLVFHCGLTCYYLFFPVRGARVLWRGLLSFPQVVPIGFDAFSALDIFSD